MVDCAMMGVDWRDLTFWQYQVMLSEWNDRHNEGGGGKPPASAERLARLKRAMAAESVH